MLSQDMISQNTRSQKTCSKEPRSQDTRSQEIIDTTETAIGRRFQSENYQLLDKIGQGGFGQVYRATQVNTGQTVAIKFLSLNSDFDEEKRRRHIERFHRETELCSRLQHPNIVRLLDKGECDEDLVYAVFEYVEGVSLKDLLQEKGAFVPSEAANLMSQVLDALAHAHAQGVIHRDLKPANIMLTKSGTKSHVKILDFGIGTLTSEARRQDFKTLTLTQESLGTPSYSAPEQLRGEPPTLKSDLYVWGLVFIECLTGQPAITGSSLASIFHKQLSQSNVPLPVSVAGHPVANLLRRVLNKNCQDRAASASDVYDDLNLINFSSLVGSHSVQANQHLSQDTDTFLDIDFQETQINSPSAYYTGGTERKQISVLCVNITIRTIYDDIMNGEVIDAFHHDQKSQCVDIAVRYGAFHVGSLGDTLLFYFGYPSVSDNDSRLCARTALEISSNLNQRNVLLKANQGIEVQIRMGMHTGLVTNYSDSVPEGDTPNTAMELARLSKPQQVLCSNASKVLLDNYIEFLPCNVTSIGVHQKTTQLHQLVGERSVEAFGFLRAKQSSYEFVGREQELNRLLTLLDNTSGSVSAHVYGEAGIGKSRLIFELRNRAQGFRHYIAQHLPEHKYNALHPVLSLISYKYSLDSLSPKQAVEQLRGHLTSDLKTRSGFEPSVALSVLCTWLHLPFEPDTSQSYTSESDTSPAKTLASLSPEAQKDVLFEVLTELLIDSSEETDNSAALFIFEDMHWADPTSIEFLSYILQHPLFKSSRSILITTSRNEIPETLKVLYDLDLPVLGLDEEKTNRFIRALFDQRNVSPAVLDIVASRTDGIPLFVEELVNMLRSKKLVQHLNGVVDFVAPDKIKEVPETLLESLQQKLDSLVSSKDTAQLAATIGREFDHALLVAASPKSEEEVQTDLNELITCDLVVRLRQVNGDTYMFKHALVRDAAYEAMGNKSRILSHSLIAKTLEGHSEEVPNYGRDTLARHFAGAENYLKAVDYGLKVVETFSQIGSNVEALNFGAELETWISQIDDSELSDLYRLKFYHLAVPIALAVYSYTSEIALAWNQSIKRILDDSDHNNLWDSETELCESLKARSDFLDFLSLHHSSQYQEAQLLGERLLASYESDYCHHDYLIPVLCFLSQNYQLQGDFDKSIVSFERTIRLYEENTYPVFMESDNDFKPYCLGMLSLSYLHIGKLDKAIETAKQATDLSIVDKYPVSCVASHIFYALCLSFKGEDELVIRACQAYYQYFYDECNPTFYTVYIDILLETAKGNLDKAKTLVIDLCKSDYDFATGWYIHFIAKKLLNIGEVDEAISLMELSLEKSTTNGEVGALPIVKNTLALALYKKNNEATQRILSLLNTSLELAIEQKAYLFVQESKSLLDLMTEVVE